MPAEVDAPRATRHAVTDVVIKNAVTDMVRTHWQDTLTMPALGAAGAPHGRRTAISVVRGGWDADNVHRM